MVSKASATPHRLSQVIESTGKISDNLNLSQGENTPGAKLQTGSVFVNLHFRQIALIS
jgi:hypothetical protein